MNEEIVQQIVDEILSSLEPLETQSAALTQFLKAKGLATEEELAPFLDQAANAANVRWRAVRVRTAALISNAMKTAEEPSKATAKQPTQSASEQAGEANEKAGQTKQDSEKQVAEHGSDKSNSEQANVKNKSDQAASQEAPNGTKPDRASAAPTKSEAASHSDVFEPNASTKSDSPAKESKEKAA
jgi:hypothetical protein